MFPCSIAELPQKDLNNPTVRPAETENKQSLPRTSESISHSDELIEGLKEWQNERRKEERYYAMVVMIPLAILLLPAIALMIYLIFNPDAFMWDIAP